ncbi:hypothetical protein ACVWXB_001552 [Streptomyces sp. TE12347]
MRTPGAAIKIFKRAPTFMNRQAVALYRLVRFGFKPAGKGFVNGISRVNPRA